MLLILPLTVLNLNERSPYPKKIIKGIDFTHYSASNIFQKVFLNRDIAHFEFIKIKKHFNQKPMEKHRQNNNLHNTQDFNISLLSGESHYQGRLVNLVIFRHSLKYDSTIKDIPFESTYSLTQLTHNKYELAFSPTLTFTLENWSTNNIQHWQKVLSQFFTQKVHDIKEYFTPVQKLNDISTNSSTYYKARGDSCSGTILLKATPLKLLQDNPLKSEELRSQINRLRQNKYTNLDLIGVYQSTNTIYVSYKSRFDLDVSLDSLNPEL